MKKLLLQASLALLLCLFAFSCEKDDEPNEPVDTSPSITGFTPNSGPVGTAVTINGENFSATPANNTVKFGTVTATVGSASASSLQVTVPEEAQTAKISVTVNGETATSSSTFTVTEDLGPTTLSLDKESLELRTTETDVLTPTADGNGANETVAWSSDNEDVAIVDQEGNVTATGAGTATITATVDNVTASCTIIVNPNVYITGYEENQNIKVATLWVNGVAIPLSDGTVDAEATAVFVDGSDIYVSGFQNHGDGNMAMLWINGEAHPLTDESTDDAQAKSVYVENENVYVVGYELDGNVRVAKLWENIDESITDLSDGSYSSIATSVFVEGTDIYVSGYRESNLNNIAKYWKNGAETELTDGTYSAFASDILYDEDEGNVYVTGMEFNAQDYSIAKIWKDGVATELTDGTAFAQARSVFVDDEGDVYVAGFENTGIPYKARLWKNGGLIDYSYGTSYTYAYSVSVSRGDVYMAGYQWTGGNDIAKLWVNGEATDLSDGTNSALANFVFLK